MTVEPSSMEPAPELLLGARGGQAASLEALIQWCYPRVRRWALVYSGDQDEAEDVTQEVVMRLADRLEAFEGRSKFSTWLYRVTVNTASDRSRRQRHRRALLDLQPIAEPVNEEDRTITAIHHQHLTQLVRALLTELPLQQRTVFDLADLQGIPQADVAEMLELEPVTVRAHLVRARRAMRQHMLERLPELGDRT